MTNDEHLRGFTAKEHAQVQRALEDLVRIQPISRQAESYDGLLPQENPNWDTLQREFTQAAVDLVLLYRHLLVYPLPRFTSMAVPQTKRKELDAIQRLQAIAQNSYSAAQLDPHAKEQRESLESTNREHLGAFYRLLDQSFGKSYDSKIPIRTGMVLGGDSYNITLSRMQITLLKGNVDILTSLMRAVLPPTPTLPPPGELPPGRRDQ